MAKPKTPTTHFRTVPVKDVLRRVGRDVKPLEEAPPKAQKNTQKDAPHSVRLAGSGD